MKFHVASASVLLAVSAPAANLAGQWDFGNPANLGQATVGADLIVGGSHTHNSSLADDGGTSLSGVVTTAGGVASFFTANHGIPANGGGSFVNQYSVVADIFSPVGSRDGWRAIFQTNAAPDGNDADYWISPASAVGVGAIGYSDNPIDQTLWTRLVITVDLNSAVTTYRNGSLFFTHSASNGVDGRHSVYPLDDQNVIHFFSDNTESENPSLNIGGVAIFDGVLTPAQAAALGGPGDAIIPEPHSALLLLLASVIGLRRRR